MHFSTPHCRANLQRGLLRYAPPAWLQVLAVISLVCATSYLTVTIMISSLPHWGAKLWMLGSLLPLILAVLTSTSLSARSKPFLGSALLCLMFLPLVMAPAVPSAYYRAFKTRTDHFQHASQGLPYLQHFLHTYYPGRVNTLMVDDSRAAWVATNFTSGAVTHGNSPASMNEAGRICELWYDKPSTLHAMPPPDRALTHAWLQGILMHELGHCLDGIPNIMTVKVNRASHDHAIRPVDATKIHTLNDYDTLIAKVPAVQWREALADMFAVGYWRLFETKQNAYRLVKTLYKERNRHKVSDPGHATMRWIKLAYRCPPPASPRQLYAWASTLRRTDTCTGNATSP